MSGDTRQRPTLERAGALWQGRFRAMASPCELLLRGADERRARRALDAVAAEAWRIEDKYSRYLPDNLVAAINSESGCDLEVDEETANLLDFAETLYDLSDGRFDLTSGVLRRVWTFDGSDRLPLRADVEAVLELVGWHRVTWERPRLRLPAGMQIDFGGIGKEYAVDRAASLAGDEDPALVNFGGDLATAGPSADPAWQVGIETPDAGGRRAEKRIRLERGALATSGDARRYVLRDDRRYGHILDPRTGWPVEGAPRSVTVAADTCTQAGMLATLAMLSGAGAEAFLDSSGVRYWIIR